MNKLKIAVFGHKSIPSRCGGVEIAVQQFAVRMAALGHEVTCYNRGGGKKTALWEGVRLKTVPMLPGKGLAAVSASIFAAFAVAFSDADLCHIHAEGPAMMSVLPKLFGKRVIVTVHGLDWQREKWRGTPGAHYIRMGEKMAVRFADEIIVLNRDTQDYFREVYGRQTRFIPNGVESPRILPPERIKAYGLKGDDYILYLGRLVPEKGIHDLIRAFRGISVDKKLVIAGAPSDTEDYASQLRTLAAGDDRILFTDFVEGRLLEELYSNAFAYVLPSHLEGMPLSLLEAMSYGNCCVISRIPGCIDAAGDHAITFPAGDVAALRDALERLCGDDTLRQHYRSCARAHVRSCPGWDEITHRTLELYHESIADS